MSIIMKGDAAAIKLSDNLKQRSEKLSEKHITPMLAIICVGEKLSDNAYLRVLEKTFAEVGIDIEEHRFNEDVNEGCLSECIERLNLRSDIHAVMIMNSLPDHIDRTAIKNLVLPEKDVDPSAGRVAAAKNLYDPVAAKAAECLMTHYGIDLEDSEVCIIGDGEVGRSCFSFFKTKVSGICLFGENDSDERISAKSSDIIISACGTAKLIDDSFLNDTKNQCIIDFGNNYSSGKLCGDVDFEAAFDKAFAISPVPGGVGALTAILLAENVFISAERSSGNCNNY